MTRSVTRIRAAALAATLAAAIAGCAGTAKQESTGEFVDDSVITAKVKTALISDKTVSGSNISVETFKGRVLLAGYAKSPDERQRAEGLARAVPGVRTVNNKIELK